MSNPFRHISVAVMMLIISITGSAAVDYETTAVKASRMFAWHEWASAEAMYMILIDEHPTSDSLYVKAIVASSIINHKNTASELLTQAMKAGVSFSRLMDGVKQQSFEVGKPQVYEDFLLRSQRDCPWLTRAIDSELLDYYLFRDNGPKIIEYAKKMLAGLPESTIYLSALAEGYMKSDNYDQAAATWQKILNIEPGNYATLLHLGNFFALKCEDEKAINYLSQAYNIKPTPYVAHLLAEMGHRNGK